MKFRTHVEPPQPMRGLEIPQEVVKAPRRRQALRHHQHTAAQTHLLPLVCVW
jgi:hypothetical protein